jgi:protein TonB
MLSDKNSYFTLLFSIVLHLVLFAAIFAFFNQNSEIKQVQNKGVKVAVIDASEVKIPNHKLPAFERKTIKKKEVLVKKSIAKIKPQIAKNDLDPPKKIVKQTAHHNLVAQIKGEDVTDNYALALTDRLERFKEYPKDIRQRVLSKVLVELRIGENGEVLSKNITKSSGNRSFDRVVIAMVNKANPFPKPPVGMANSNFLVPVVFN